MARRKPYPCTAALSVALLSFSFVSQTLAGGHAEPVTPQGIRLGAHTIESQVMNWAYPVYVYLPSGYADAERSFAVLYTLDAESRFNRIADMLDAGNKQVILVAVGATLRERREADYTWPNAPDYYRFLTQEVLPFAESNYRTDETNRTLAGFSMGGLMAILAMFSEVPGNRYFNSYLVGDGSFWNQTEQTEALEAALAAKTDSLPITLFMTIATRGNYKSVSKFYELLSARNYKDLNLIYRSVETNHAAAFSPSFELGIEALYP